MTGRPAFAAIVIGAGALGAGGYWLWSRSTAPVATSQTEAAPSPVPASHPLTLVDRVPQFQLPDRDGELRTLGHWSGKSLIVNFWATWCAPCRREIPLLQRIARERAPNGFQVVGIAVDFREKVLAYAQQMQIDYPLLIGEQEGLDAAAAFGIDAIGFPFTVFSDAEGRIIAAHMGELHADEAKLILDGVEAVNAGRLTPAVARERIAAGLAALQQAPGAKSAG